MQLLQKAKIILCSGFKQNDEELKDVEQKPLTNEDKLDLLLAQMMETAVKSSEKVTQVHKQTQNVDENISQEIAEINSGQICNTGARHNS